MTREQVWDIIGDIDDRFVAEAAQYDPKQRSRSPERIGVMSKKRLITFALAAALILALGVTGLVSTYVYNYFVAKTLFPAYREEQFLTMYGMLTGTASTGVALLREIDNKFKQALDFPVEVPLFLVHCITTC